MDADKKLTALKKVYADIIQRISNETAARVLVSERKSAMFQHELKVAKDEGVRMLVRLKQMMDNQNLEAEAASLIQCKKIEELESQLQEAEDIVRDLRDKMEDVQAKLESVKMENFHHMNELRDVCSKEVPIQSSDYLPPNESSVANQIDAMVPDISQKNGCLECFNKSVCSCDVFTGNQDLPSIIVVDKDPDLYRNGCTQRIRACERNLLDRDSSLSEESDEVKEKKSCGELKEAKQSPKEAAFVVNIPTELEKKLLADINFETSKSFSPRRKRASGQKKTILLLGGKLPEHSVTSCPISVNDKAHSTETPSRISPQLSLYKAEPQSQLNAVEIDGAKTMCEDEGEKGKMVPSEEITECSESSLFLKDVEKVDVPSSGSESKISDTTNGLTSQPVTFLKGRDFKYTYQRKRKRQALSQSEDETGKKTGDGKNSGQKLEQVESSLLRESSGDHRKCSSKVIVSCGKNKNKKKGDGKNGVQKVEQPESDWLEGSLREHKQLVQVARQLLSLSNEDLWR